MRSDVGDSRGARSNWRKRDCVGDNLHDQHPESIRTVPRVVAVKLDYEAGQALVATEICRPVPVEVILSAIEQAGYSGEKISVHTGSYP